ncbi:uncharacterized protein EV420DRAFT_1646588 [Desarmillaria tabescens]|uniref:Uncharacterized protein n=1 Tax=Armillaria tabescens TaxID=1929756 RepID=A0AA39JWR5_ARMTA|nr:uncharacterized protein EV420DRAFT_1646588 [Desarmillaria tabescens]KAK0450351.1 hypothetical protein EV420DRAFT_1646588 [Desarmillaria tabescens]
MAQLPFELVEIIISEFWYAEHPSDDRIAFMTGCPLLCRVWRDVYATITSQDIHVPTQGYLFYLSSIIRTKRSSIYRPFLSKSTRTITCHVDLIESNDDPALFPYIVFCHMPNYAGFRKCFPDIQCINLEIKLLGRPWKVFNRIIRTRVSIRLDELFSLSALPVDWYITIDDAPDIGEVNPSKLKHSWSDFLGELVRDMCQYSLQLRGMSKIVSYNSVAEGSTCFGGTRHFRHRTYCEERNEDIWGINRRFWKAGRTLTNVKTFFSGLFDDLFWNNCSDAKFPMWRFHCNTEQGSLGPRIPDGRAFTMKNGVIVTSIKEQEATIRAIVRDVIYAPGCISVCNMHLEVMSTIKKDKASLRFANIFGSPVRERALMRTIERHCASVRGRFKEMIFKSVPNVPLDIFTLEMNQKFRHFCPAPTTTAAAILEENTARRNALLRNFVHEHPLFRYEPDADDIEREMDKARSLGEPLRMNKRMHLVKAKG